MSVILVIWEVQIGRSLSKANPRKKCNTLSKNNLSVAQGVEHLPSKHKALHSNPNTEKLKIIYNC
jgi:hypothetical protein